MWELLLKKFLPLLLAFTDYKYDQWLAVVANCYNYTMGAEKRSASDCDNQDYKAINVPKQKNHIIRMQNLQS